MQNRRHSTDQDEIHLCADQRRNDLREINGHRFCVAGFFLPAAVLQPFAARASAFARVVPSPCATMRCQGHMKLSQRYNFVMARVSGLEKKDAPWHLRWFYSVMRKMFAKDLTPAKI